MLFLQLADSANHLTDSPASFLIAFIVDEHSMTGGLHHAEMDR
jgi:hypothetical protein